MKQKDKKIKCVLMYPLGQGEVISSEVVPGKGGSEESHRLAQEIMKLLEARIKSEDFLKTLLNIKTPLILISKKSAPLRANEGRCGISDWEVKINTVCSTARRSKIEGVPEKRVPFIEFGGHWLRKAGFKIGMKFEIWPGRDHLLLKTIDDDPTQSRNRGQEHG